MNTISARISTTPLTLADGSKPQPQKLSPEMVAAQEEMLRNQFRTPVISEPDGVYATVKVNGKVVATLYNSGASVTSNSNYSKLKSLPSMGESETATGPELAQKRADEIAKTLGGTIEKAPTAQTSDTWKPQTVTWIYDEEAITAALAARNANARTMFDAQLLGQENKNNT